jgi:hypothetical protein
VAVVAVTILAPLAVGVPPIGAGIYSRGVIPRPGPWRWYTGREFAFVGVEAMNSAEWETHAEAAAQEAVRSGRVGIILDREDRTPASVVSAIARFIRRWFYRLSIGFTSYPAWNGLPQLASEARGLFWGSPQLYFDAPTNAAGWRRWTAELGLRNVPSIAAYIEGSAPSRAALDRQLRGTPEAYDRYLASIPYAAGVIAWPTHGPIPTFMVSALDRRYGVGGTMLGLPFAVGSAIDSWPGLVVVIVVLVLALLSLGGLLGSHA